MGQQDAQSGGSLMVPALAGAVLSTRTLPTNYDGLMAAQQAGGIVHVPSTLSSGNGSADASTSSRSKFLLE
jgi:hypothetical protein